MEARPHPALRLPLESIGGCDWCPVTTPPPPLQVLVAGHRLPRPAEVWGDGGGLLSGKIVGGPLRCLMAFIDSVLLPFSLCWAPAASRGRFLVVKGSCLLRQDDSSAFSTVGQVKHTWRTKPCLGLAGGGAGASSGSWWAELHPPLVYLAGLSTPPSCQVES